MTRQVNGAVDGEAGGIHAMRAVIDLVAVDVDLHQRGGRDLLPTPAVRIDEEPPRLAGNADRRMRVDEIRHLVMGEQAITGGELDALAPFGGLVLDGEAG